MALTKCKECGNGVSDTAATCPQCGAKQPRPWSLGKRLVMAFFALIVGSCVAAIANRTPAPAPKPDQRTAEQKAKDAKDYEAMINDLKLAKALRLAMKNPDLFEVVEALHMDDGTLCITYRATNSYNAKTVEQKAISTAGSLVNWTAKCAKKVGTDRTRYLQRELAP